MWLSDFINHSYDYSPNWTSPSHITIILNYLFFTSLMNRNYGPTILAQRHAEMQGLQQVLWLFGEERQVRSCCLA